MHWDESGNPEPLGRDRRIGGGSSESLTRPEPDSPDPENRDRRVVQLSAGPQKMRVPADVVSKKLYGWSAKNRPSICRRPAGSRRRHSQSARAVGRTNAGERGLRGVSWVGAVQVGVPHLLELVDAGDIGAPVGGSALPTHRTADCRAPRPAHRRGRRPWVALKLMVYFEPA